MIDLLLLLTWYEKRETYYRFIIPFMFIRGNDTAARISINHLMDAPHLIERIIGLRPVRLFGNYLINGYNGSYRECDFRIIRTLLDLFLYAHIVSEIVIMDELNRTKIDKRFCFQSERNDLIQKVSDYFKIPEYGLYLLFHNEEIDSKAHYNPQSYLPAYHTNIISGKKGMGIDLPPVVIEIIIQEKYSNLIFVSKNVCERQPIEFAWLLAHELRHLEQDLISHDLSVANDFLDYVFPYIETEEPKVSLSIPCEFDAQMKAWKVTRFLFDGEKTLEFVIRKSKEGAGVQLFKHLPNENPDREYNAVRETIKMLRKYREEIELKRNTEGASWKKWIRELDINDYCTRLEKV